VPCEPLDAAENLPKEGSRQGPFGKLQGEVPGMSDEASAGLDDPLPGLADGQLVEWHFFSDANHGCRHPDNDGFALRGSGVASGDELPRPRPRSRRY
jgi:hypothetical protein